jgi:hypothetical protein
LNKELEKRLLRLEQALPGVRARSPLREYFERRRRISNLYLAWRLEGGERPDLSHPRDQECWEYMEMIGEVIDEMAAEGLLGPHPDE